MLLEEGWWEFHVLIVEFVEVEVLKEFYLITNHCKVKIEDISSAFREHECCNGSINCREDFIILLLLVILNIKDF